MQIFLDHLGWRCHTALVMLRHMFYPLLQLQSSFVNTEEVKQLSTPLLKSVWRGVDTAAA